MFKTIFYENCPLCDTKLESIMKENTNIVIDWFCNKCGISFSLEDLGYEEIEEQTTIDKWFK